MPEDVEFGRAWVIGLLAAFAVPPVAMGAGAAVGGLGDAATGLVFLVPLGAITVVLGRLALRVGSSADDPDSVDDRVSRSLGVDREDDPWEFSE